MKQEGKIMEKRTGVRASFDLMGRVAVITGGAGMLGIRHGEAVAEMGGIPVLVDLDRDRAEGAWNDIADRYGGNGMGLGCDITQEDAVESMKASILERFGHVDILINNAAQNPKMEGGLGRELRLEHLSLSAWQADLDGGLTGAFLCSRVLGPVMAAAGQGVILNVASDLGLIAPDQRIYRETGLVWDRQPVKPVTYSVVMAGLIGLTRYLATYWASQGVRANALAPGEVEAGQDPGFIKRLTRLIPMGRMARKDEYKAVVAFMVSDASSYMNGSVLNVDGGRTVW